MSQKTFERAMLRDLGAVGLVAGGIIAASMAGPDWLGGVLAVLLIPVALLVLVALVVFDEHLSRRRDTDLPGAGHVHDSGRAPTASSAAATGALSSTRRGRHSYRVARPER